MKKYISGLLILTGLVWAGSTFSCKPSGTTDETTKSASMNDSERILEKEKFASAIRKSGAVVVDVRMPQEYEQSHIDNAININFFDPEFKYKLLELDRNKKYYLYCKNEVRSYRSMKFMEDNNFKDVFILKGGYQDWNTVHAEDEQSH